MEIKRVSANVDTLLNPQDAVWLNRDSENVPLIPTPLNGNPMIKKISPFIEKSTDHGVVTELSITGAHNGDFLAIRLSWASEKHAEIIDLDEFVDGAAVMFPLTAKASAFTMGSESDPVNAWYWKANLKDEAFDVVARGYGTSARAKSAHDPIACRAVHEGGRWHLVMGREMGPIQGRAGFAAGYPTRVAFAVWDGGNRERSGRKSFSGEFVSLPLEP
jgi:DMSO reductase family type II enzyme heme b subunit